MARLHRVGVCTLWLAGVLGLGNQTSRAQSLPARAGADAAPLHGAADTAVSGARGVSLEDVADLQLARGAYVATLATLQQIQPRTAVIWNEMGVAYHHLYAFDEAMTCYREAVALDRHYSQAYNNIGAVYYGRRRFSAAVKEYKLALKYKPRQAVTFSNLGTAYFAEAKYKKGVAEYRSALKIDPAIFASREQQAVEEAGTKEQRMEKYFYVAEIYATFGRTEDALASLRKAFSEGFNDRKRLREDKELALLRDTPEFHQLLIEEHME